MTEAPAPQPPETSAAVVVEELVFEVAPTPSEHWIEADAGAWDDALAASPGFLGKEVWVSADGPGPVRVVIWWRSMEDQRRAARALQQDADSRMGALYREPVGHDLRRVRRLEPDDS